MHAINTKPTLNNMCGFTLVELMVTVFLTAIAVIAIYRGYTTFSQSADAQQQTMEMQQNLRIGMTTLVKDIMRAGMNDEDESVAGFISIDLGDGPTNDVDKIAFSMDLGSANGSGVNNLDPPFASDTPIDNDGDGDIDEDDEARIGDGFVDDDGERIYYALSGEDLQRRLWDADLVPPGYGPAQTVINNVSFLEFVYLDEDENLVNGGVLPITDPAVLANIDTVVVTLVVRTTNEDYRITNKETYQNLLLTDIYTAPGDNFRRRAMSMRVKVRNANL